jgi:hypothetical protein
MHRCPGNSATGVRTPRRRLDPARRHDRGGETLEQTLAREVREEACAQVLACAYIGCQLVEPLDDERAPFYQTRFWARVELDPFTPSHEMTARRLVAPSRFLDNLFWGRETTAALILERGLRIQAKGGASPA